MNWLATLPSTNALVVAVIFMVIATTLGVLAGWHPPEGWFPFVMSFATLVSAHFTAKRLTNGKGVKTREQRPDSDGTVG